MDERVLIHTRALDFWVARGAIVAIVALQIVIINDLSFGHPWLAPGLELILLVPLVVLTAISLKMARRAMIDDDFVP